ncbi:Hypothetical predicted protein [Paramuricea clavata]|uniref:Uncharacterized protein n=1 Tax=Paramuricea clavata TaxID=317549 RepID=A0A7D9DIP8_PARCT|nr:Hypothetical predicted protein [Paramuricea clavata]
MRERYILGHESGKKGHIVKVIKNQKKSIGSANQLYKDKVPVYRSGGLSQTLLKKKRTRTTAQTEIC